MKSDISSLYSVIIPVGTRVDDLSTLIGEYADALRQAAVSFEIIVVLDGPKDELWAGLQNLETGSDDWLKVIELSREFGESVALMAGFGEAQGDVLMTLPAYWQIESSQIRMMIEAASDEDDIMIAVRWPRAGSAFDRFRRNFFHGILRFVSGQQYRDLGCGVRLMKRPVVEEIPLYGDQHRFLPVLALRRGFNVREVDVTQSPKDDFRGRYRLREYLHRILDILTVFFLVRFTKKPLRFFGSIGFLTVGFGSVFVLVLVIQRLFFGMGLAGRPALMLASLLIVLGVQLFGLGLLGELIIFSHATESKDYTIRKVIGSKSAK